MSEPSPLEREFRIRLAAMQWLSSFGGETTFRYGDLRAFHFEGERVPLKDYGRGIWKPRHLEAALSLSTVYTPPNEVPPYEDQGGPDGLQRYKYRGDNPNQADNVALRQAMVRELPLIWFVGVSGSYLPMYPVYLVAEEREQRQFVVALDQVQRHLFPPAGVEVSIDDRHYAHSITKQRLHQPLFRARVIEAYEQRCAMCRLRHVSLLDASHILADGHALGQPVVPNGLALCNPPRRVRPEHPRRQPRPSDRRPPRHPGGGGRPDVAARHSGAGRRATTGAAAASLQPGPRPAGHPLSHVPRRGLIAL